MSNTCGEACTMMRLASRILIAMPTLRGCDAEFLNGLQLTNSIL